MPWRHCSPMTAKGPVNGPTTPTLTVDFSAAVVTPERGKAHNNTVASRDVHKFIVTLLGDTVARPATARFLLAIKSSFHLPRKKLAFAGRGQEGFEPMKAPL